MENTKRARISFTNYFVVEVCKIQMIVVVVVANTIVITRIWISPDSKTNFNEQLISGTELSGIPREYLRLYNKILLRIS